MKPHLLLHDNAQPYTAKKTQYHVNDLNFDLLEHSPYSPDLAPRDYAIFPSLKKHLRLRIFESRDNLEGEVRRVLMHEIPLRAYVDAIDSLFTRWTQCCRQGAGFVEKVSVGCDGDAE
jgi:histone-lysine N-methyltransferase SETMAR